MLGATAMNDATNPTCFISYSHDSEEHKAWVRKLAKALISKGVKVTLDQWDLKLGMDLAHFMETGVRNAQTVLLIGTPRFADKANQGQGGVGYEKNIVTASIYNNLGDPTKFVPIVREGEDHTKALPTYLLGKLGLDMRKDEEFDKKLEELIYHIYEESLNPRPGLGKKPKFSASNATPNSKSGESTSSALVDFTNARDILPALTRLLRLRLDYDEVSICWFSLFGQAMVNALPGKSMGECILALCDRAQRQNKLPALIQILRSERPDLVPDLDELGKK
jgi:TIR domain